MIRPLALLFPIAAAMASAVAAREDKPNIVLILAENPGRTDYTPEEPSPSTGTFLQLAIPARGFHAWPLKKSSMPMPLKTQATA